jgi:predicted transcriptional regulator
MREIAMPGGRLTQQDRQQIAAGLADSLAYAEIARRLDRPTSTITREVMRNGGPTGYRADLAHHATERRTHRRRKVAPGSNPVPQPYGRDAEAVREYEEMLTTVFIGSGLPKMMARVLGCLYTTDAGSLTAFELTQHLQVSPASISKAITVLESLDLIRRQRPDGQRRERYVVDDDLWYQSMIRSARDNAQLSKAARQGVAILGRGTPAATRLENIARFLDFVTESLTRAAEQARDVLYTKTEETSDDTAKPRSDHG